ncbi:MAG: hypothetical protein ABF967_08140 [Lacticaseibacillus paracasei]
MKRKNKRIIIIVSLILLILSVIVAIKMLGPKTIAKQVQLLVLFLHFLLMLCGVILLISSLNSSEKKIRHSLNKWTIDIFLIGPILGWIGKKTNIKYSYQKALFILGLVVIIISVFNIIQAF